MAQHVLRDSGWSVKPTSRDASRSMGCSPSYDFDPFRTCQFGMEKTITLLLIIKYLVDSWIASKVPNWDNARKAWDLHGLEAYKFNRYQRR